MIDLTYLRFAALAAALVVPIGSVLSGPAEHHADWTIRGGFDSNPNDAAGGRSSPVISAGVDYVYRTEAGGRAVLVAAGVRGDAFAPGTRLPADTLRGTLETATALGASGSQRFTASILRETEDGTRRSTMALRQRLEHREGPVKLFVNVEARGQTINEVNVLFDGYLPAPQQFATLAATPGLAWTDGTNEIGLSMAASRVRHLTGKDYLGLDRDQNRLQPFLFTTFHGQAFRFEGSVSHLSARFDRGDYGPFARLLYDARLTVPAGPLELAVAASRTVRDTTFPTAEFEVLEGWEARATHRWSDAAALSGFVRHRRKTYDGPDLDTRTMTLGLEHERRIGEGATLAVSAGWRKVRQTGGRDVHAGLFAVALSRRTDFR